MLCRIGPGVRFVRGIEMSASRGQIGRAAISKFMHMKAMFTRTQARDFRLDLHPVGDFREPDSAADFVACSGMQHGNGLQWSLRFFLRRLRPRRNGE